MFVKGDIKKDVLLGHPGKLEFSEMIEHIRHFQEKIKQLYVPVLGGFR